MNAEKEPMSLHEALRIALSEMYATTDLRAWSLYGSAWGGYSRELRAPDWGASAGVRGRW